jgi:hypothetical protein
MNQLDGRIPEDFTEPLLRRSRLRAQIERHFL